MNEGAFPLVRAFSSWSRTIRPFGIPDCFDAWSSHDARSSVSRIVIVLLIWLNRNTYRHQNEKQRWTSQPLTRADRAVALAAYAMMTVTTASAST